MDIRRRRGSQRSDADSDASDVSDSRRRQVRRSVSRRRNGASKRKAVGQRRPRVSRGSNSQSRRRRRPAARPRPTIEGSETDEGAAPSVQSQRVVAPRPTRRPRRASDSSQGRRRRAYVRGPRGSTSSVSVRRGRRNRAPVRSARSVPRDAGVQEYYPNASPIPGPSGTRGGTPRSNIRFLPPVAADSIDDVNAPVQPFNPSRYSTPLQSNRNRRIVFDSPSSRYGQAPNSARRRAIDDRERTPMPTSATRQARHRNLRLGSVDYGQPRRLFDESSGDDDVFEQENSSFYRTPPTRTALRIRARENTPMPTSAGRQARHRWQRIARRSLSSTSDEEGDSRVNASQRSGRRMPQPTPSFIRRRSAVAGPSVAPDVAVDPSGDEAESSISDYNAVHAGSTPNQSARYSQSDDADNLVPLAPVNLNNVYDDENYVPPPQ